MSKIAVFTMDVESFTDIECLKNIKFKEDYNVNDGIKNYLDLLNKYNIKSNLFVLSSFVDSNKEILKEALNDGHKIALHGYDHTSPSLLNDNDFKNGIIKAKKHINELLKIEVNGYRAPCFSISNSKFSILEEMNFTYDSSYVDYKHTYNKSIFELSNFEKIYKCIYKKNDLYEFSLPVCNNFPVGGGGYVRIAPWFFVKSLIKKYIKKNDLYIFYLHPFETSSANLPKIKQLKFYDKMYINYNRHQKYLNRIEKIIKLLIKNGFEFKTFEDIINKIKKPNSSN